jgi:hypothetical protein
VIVGVVERFGKCVLGTEGWRAEVVVTASCGRRQPKSAWRWSKHTVTWRSTTMRIGEIVKQGERELPQWEPSREAPEPAPAPAPEKTEPEKVSAS